MASETQPFELAGGLVTEVITAFFLFLILPFLAFQK
jgi:hypothetical protein